MRFYYILSINLKRFYYICCPIDVTKLCQAQNLISIPRHCFVSLCTINIQTIQMLFIICLGKSVYHKLLQLLRCPDRPLALTLTQILQLIPPNSMQHWFWERTRPSWFACFLEPPNSGNIDVPLLANQGNTPPSDGISVLILKSWCSACPSNSCANSSSESKLLLSQALFRRGSWLLLWLLLFFLPDNLVSSIYLSQN